MKRVSHSFRRRPTPRWHQAFVAMMPVIETHARISFRHLDADAKEEAVQNCLTNAMVAYLRLYELGKVDLAYPSVLARYAVAQTKDGRVTGNRLCVRDVSSPYAQKTKGTTLERLDHYDREANEWKEVLVEDRHCGPFDIVRTKLDFADWLNSLKRRDRRIAELLALGNHTTDVARRFKVCAGRVSQLRRELQRSWRQFVGEVPTAA